MALVPSASDMLIMSEEDLSNRLREFKQREEDEQDKKIGGQDCNPEVYTAIVEALCAEHNRRHREKQEQRASTALTIASEASKDFEDWQNKVREETADPLFNMAAHSFQRGLPSDAKAHVLGLRAKLRERLNDCAEGRKKGCKDACQCTTDDKIYRAWFNGKMGSGAIQAETGSGKSLAASAQLIHHPCKEQRELLDALREDNPDIDPDLLLTDARALITVFKNAEAGAWKKEGIIGPSATDAELQNCGLHRIHGVSIFRLRELNDHVHWRGELGKQCGEQKCRLLDAWVVGATQAKIAHDLSEKDRHGQSKTPIDYGKFAFVIRDEGDQADVVKGDEARGPKSLDNVLRKFWQSFWYYVSATTSENMSSTQIPVITQCTWAELLRANASRFVDFHELSHEGLRILGREFHADPHQLTNGEQWVLRANEVTVGSAVRATVSKLWERRAEEYVTYVGKIFCQGKIEAIWKYAQAAAEDCPPCPMTGMRPRIAIVHCGQDTDLNEKHLKQLQFAIGYDIIISVDMLNRGYSEDFLAVALNLVHSGPGIAAANNLWQRLGRVKRVCKWVRAAWAGVEQSAAVTCCKNTGCKACHEAATTSGLVCIKADGTPDDKGYDMRHRQCLRCRDAVAKETEKRLAALKAVIFENPDASDGQLVKKKQKADWFELQVNSDNKKHFQAKIREHKAERLMDERGRWEQVHMTNFMHEDERDISPEQIVAQIRSTEDAKRAAASAARDRNLVTTARDLASSSRALDRVLVDAGHEGVLEGQSSSAQSRGSPGSSRAPSPEPVRFQENNSEDESEGEGEVDDSDVDGVASAGGGSTLASMDVDGPTRSGLGKRPRPSYLDDTEGDYEISWDSDAESADDPDHVPSAGPRARPSKATSNVRTREHSKKIAKGQKQADKTRAALTDEAKAAQEKAKEAQEAVEAAMALLNATEARNQKYAAFSATGNRLEIAVVHDPEALNRKRVEFTVQNAAPGFQIVLCESKALSDPDEEQAEYCASWTKYQTEPIPQEHDASEPFTFVLDEEFLPNQLRASASRGIKRIAAVLEDPDAKFQCAHMGKMSTSIYSATVFYNHDPSAVIDWRALDAACTGASTQNNNGGGSGSSSATPADVGSSDDDDDDDDDDDNDGDDSTHRERIEDFAEVVQRLIIKPCKDHLKGNKKVTPKKAKNCTHGEKFNDLLMDEVKLDACSGRGNDAPLVVGLVQALMGDKREGSMLNDPNNHLGDRYSAPITGWLAIYTVLLTELLALLDNHRKSCDSFRNAIAQKFSIDVMPYTAMVEDPESGAMVDNPAAEACWEVLKMCPGAEAKIKDILDNVRSGMDSGQMQVKHTCVDFTSTADGRAGNLGILGEDGQPVDTLHNHKRGFDFPIRKGQEEVIYPQLIRNLNKFWHVQYKLKLDALTGVRDFPNPEMRDKKRAATHATDARSRVKQAVRCIIAKYQEEHKPVPSNERRLFKKHPHQDFQEAVKRVGYRNYGDLPRDVNAYREIFHK